MSPVATASAPLRTRTAEIADPDGPYVGFATRAVALAIDAAIVNGVAIAVAAGLTLIMSLLHLPIEIKRVVAGIGTGAYVLWAVGYFVWFWSATGQTPGGRIMRFRVVPARGGKLKPRRALVRCVGLVLAALPLFAGYLMILFDGRRRGLQDRLARTVVVEAPQLSVAQVRRQQPRALKPEPSSSQSDDDRGRLLPQA